MSNTPRFIFFGTPAFAVTVLSKLLEAELEPIAVVASPARPAGRGRIVTNPAMVPYAHAHGITVLQPENLTDVEFLARLRTLNADAFVIASFGHILPGKLLAIPPRGVINVHPSLLPKHRGASPIQTAILNGDAVTGVTLMLTDERMDHGPILAQQKLRMDPSHATYIQLHDALAQLGGAMLAETLPKWLAGNITPYEQNHELATFTKLFTKEDGHIDWTKPALETDRMVRALNPWPSTWTTIGSPTSDCYNNMSEVGLPTVKRVKILSGHATNEKTNMPPGTITKTKNGDLAVACGDGKLYAVDMLQMEGGKKIEGGTFSEKFSDREQKVSFL